LSADLVATASELNTLPPQVSPPDLELSEALLSAHGLTALGAGSVVAVPVLPGEESDGEVGGPILGPGAAELVELLDLDLLALLEHHQASGKAGEIISHPVLGHPQVDLVLCVGLGAARPADFRSGGAALARAVKDRDLLVTTVTALADDASLRAFVEGLVLGSFEFHWRSEGPKAHPVRRVVLAATADRQQVLDRAVTVAEAGWLARAMATTPSNLKNPGWLADRAAGLAEEHGLDLEVWDETQLADEGFGGIVAVGKGSATPPRLIQLGYTPEKKRRGAAHVVLIGKGITFDTGGLSIKPAEAMLNMKRDMTGAGVVLATMAALARMDCQVRVTGLVAAAENAIGAASFRPGDVIRHYGGRTTEVTNTDAEGRLVLADALAYAVAKLKPDVLVDVATLTGAVKVALGLGTGGLFANRDLLADRLTASGAEAGELFWRLPLAADYEDKLSSKVADADNGAGNPGAITAALFLQHFAGDLPWAHLDIASVGDSTADKGVYTTGPTGFGARTLLHWLEQDDPTEGLS
jgi:leucyl aminopeptidase